MDMNTAFFPWDAIERDEFGRPIALSAWRGRAPARASAYRLLVPIDGSAAAVSVVRVAAQMADRLPEAELHLLNVQVCPSSAEDALEREGLHDTSAARGALDAMGATYCLHLVAGTPAETIRAFARTHAVAEIVMGSHGGGDLERLLIGSVAMDVAEKADVPVTLVKAGDRAGRLPADWIDWLLPCDGSASALRAADYLARRLAARGGDPRIHVLSVQPVPDDAAAACGKARATLEAAGLACETHVRAGDPAARILELAAELGCGHIVMGTRGLSLLGKLMLGSVSGAVARAAHLPLTLIP